MATYFVVGFVITVLICLVAKLVRENKHQQTLREQIKAKPFRIVYEEKTQLYFLQEASIFPALFHHPPELIWSGVKGTCIVNGHPSMVFAAKSIEECQAKLAEYTAIDAPLKEVWP